MKKKDNQKAEEFMRDLVQRVQQGNYNGMAYMFPNDHMSIESGFSRVPTRPQKKKKRKHFYLSKKQGTAIKRYIDKRVEAELDFKAAKLGQNIHDIKCMLAAMFQVLSYKDPTIDDEILKVLPIIYQSINNDVKNGSTFTQPKVLENIMSTIPAELRSLILNLPDDKAAMLSPDTYTKIVAEAMAPHVRTTTLHQEEGFTSETEFDVVQYFYYNDLYHKYIVMREALIKIEQQLQDTTLKGIATLDPDIMELVGQVDPLGKVKLMDIH